MTTLRQHLRKDDLRNRKLSFLDVNICTQKLIMSPFFAQTSYLKLFFHSFGQPSTYCGDSLIMWIQFSKAMSKERIKLCWYVGSVLYPTKFWWLLRLVYGSVGKLVWYFTPLYHAFHLWLGFKKNSFTESETGSCCNSMFFKTSYFSLNLLYIVLLCLPLIKEATSSMVLFLLTDWWMVFLNTSLVIATSGLLIFASDEA